MCRLKRALAALILKKMYVDGVSDQTSDTLELTFIRGICINIKPANSNTIWAVAQYHQRRYCSQTYYQNGIERDCHPFLKAAYGLFMLGRLTIISLASY